MQVTTDVSATFLRYGSAVKWAPQEIKARRDALGLTQQQFAERIGASARTIHSWESGESQPQKRWRKVLDEVLGAETEAAHAPSPEDVGPTLRAASKWELLAELARRLEEGGQRQDRPGQAVLDPNSLDPEIAEALGVDQDDTQQRRRA